MIETTSKAQEWSARPATGLPYKMIFKNITPRLYQETILGTCAEKNCLVVLPTGMGKTVVALMLAVQRLRSFPNSKVLFLAPTRPLVEQHLQTFLDNLELSDGEMAVFTGNVKPEKRAEMWKEAKIIFSTPQGLENDMISGRIDLSEVSLLVFDEAHRATGDYSYSFVAKQYNRKARYPRILALTASPGSEAEKIDEVCKNLFIEGVELRTDSDPDVLPYIQETNIKWIKVDFPASLERIRKYLKESYNSKLSDVKNYGYVKSEQLQNGKTQILRRQGALHSEIAKGDKSPEILKSVSLLAEAMKVEHAIELVETQGITPLFGYFQKIYSEAATTKVRAVQNLANDINFKSAFVITRQLSDDGIDHPKLAALLELVSEEVSANKDVKIIIFNQFRDNAKKVKEMLEALPGVSARMFFGQAKKNGTGLSQKEQKQMLEDFKAGMFNCLVATSVAEEGIDIPRVDLVVFYEPVPSGIRTIQRRGRTGRQEKGRVCVLMTKGTREEAYKWSAHNKEKRMYRELSNLRHKFTGLTARLDAPLDKYIAPETSLSVVVDMREKASGVLKELMDLGVSVSLKTLEAADYVLSGRVGVEYKRVPDFVDSIVDGRLLEQMKALRNSFERPLVIVEGEEDIYSQRNLHPNAIRGMLSTIMVSYGIPVVQTKNSKETAAFMAVVAKREQESASKEFNPHGSRKPLALREQQEYIVSALPGVGPCLAKPLLERFGSVKNVVNAGEDALKSVDKIGEKRAKEIRKTLDEYYTN